ncbi:MAG: 8-oxo-dGTPase [Candidatus Woesebacteria bacterium GW2011_GWB1_39_10b]|uniref:8-oxo-dGTPase n=1 Tax=Candidatus Woesebacteria bacterium GW2011_GWB1_39_10b TaxID=1618573 RepID=A0A0G0P6X9_9BACT|nr:MAG: 8-oxo-dGTPase [Candidatus Woesebacteria bacterium GW2011_GWB1_39_10b]
MINYKFCPYCGSPSKKYKEYFKCGICGKVVYLASYPTASAFIIKNGKYLISKRAIEPDKGMYDVIGGFLRGGELPEEGLKREFKEETGSSVKILDLLGVYTGKYNHQGDLSQMTMLPHFIGSQLALSQVIFTVTGLQKH